MEAVISSGRKRREFRALYDTIAYMEKTDFNALLKTEAYDFIRKDKRLGDRIILLGVSGSRGYGTEQEGSDTDFRGVTLNLPSDMTGLTSFEQFEDRRTDTVIYGFNKFIRLLIRANPNIIELLGLSEYPVLKEAGRKLLENKHLFLSRQAGISFRHFADAQLRKLQNASARDRISEEQRQRHILNSVSGALENFRREHPLSNNEKIRLYIDASSDQQPDIFTDVSLTHYPLRQYTEMMNTLHSVVRDYDKVRGDRSRKDDNHLNKHAMHLIRLLMTGEDILNKHEIITRRPQEDLELLRKIREGAYMEDGVMTPAYYEIAGEYRRRFEEAEKNTTLPERPDTERIGRFMEDVNKQIILEQCSGGGNDTGSTAAGVYRLQTERL